MDNITGDVAYTALDANQRDLAKDVKGFWNTRYQIPYILESNPYPNLIALVFADFLKVKKLVRGSNPHFSFNRPLPTRQTHRIILDVTNVLTVIRCISNVLDGFEDDILWEDDGEDKNDSDWVTDNDSFMSDDGESDE